MGKKLVFASAGTSPSFSSFKLCFWTIFKPQVEPSLSLLIFSSFKLQFSSLKPFNQAYQYYCKAYLYIMREIMGKKYIVLAYTNQGGTIF